MIIILSIFVNLLISLSILRFIKKGKIVKHSKFLTLINIIQIILLFLPFVALLVVSIASVFLSGTAIFDFNRTHVGLILYIYIIASGCFYMQFICFIFKLVFPSLMICYTKTQ